MTIAELAINHGGAELAAAARSYIYRLLAAAFSFPGEEFLEALRSGEWGSHLETLAGHLPFGPVVDSAPPAPAPDLQEAYVSTFEVGPGRPFCPLYEGSHRSGRMKLMEELVRFYEHFGLKTQPGDHPDHVAAELEFMHYLAFKEAAALAHSQPADDVRRAQRDFLGRHLCRWLPRLRNRLAAGRDVPEFYVFAADLAREFCRRDLEWLSRG